MDRLLGAFARLLDLDDDAVALGRRCAVVCWLFYLLTAGGHAYSLDGVLMYHQAIELIRHRDLMFEYPITWAGAEYATSFYGVGMSLVLIPAVLLWSPLIRFVRFPQGADDLGLLGLDPLYAMVVMTVNPLVTAATVFVLALFALRLTNDRRLAVACALVFGLVSPAAPFARQDWSQPLVTLLLLVAVAAAAAVRPGRLLGAALVAGGCAGYTVLTRPEFVVFAGPVGLLLAWRVWREDRRRLFVAAVAFLAPFALGCALYGLTNWLRFGSPVAAGPYSTEGLRGSVLVGLAGLLVSPVVGLVWYMPIVLLLPGGAARLARSDPPARRVVAVAGALTVAFLLVYSWWGIWWGGLGWGPRFLLPLVPYFTLAAVVGGWSWGDRAANGTGPGRALLGLAMLMALATLTGIVANPLVSARELPGFDVDRTPLVTAWGEVFGQPKVAVDPLWLKYGWGSGGMTAIPFLLIGWHWWKRLRPLATFALGRGDPPPPARPPAGDALP